jgi:hypothetical protein
MYPVTGKTRKCKSDEYYSNYSRSTNDEEDCEEVDKRKAQGKSLKKIPAQRRPWAYDERVRHAQSVKVYDI